MHISGENYWVFLAFAIGIAAVCFYVAFGYLRRARIIEDTPTAKIRSAAQGFIELSGSALSDKDNKVISKLTDTECCWYRYLIEKKGNKRWDTVEKGSSEYPFIIQDDTGRCMVMPKGAEVTPSDQSVWYGTTRQPEERNPQKEPVKMSVGGFRVTMDRGINFNGKFEITKLFTQYRYTEERIYAGDVIYALGHFRSLNEVDHSASRSKITREILNFWKQDQSRMVERFDQDRDGQIDANEWEVARDSASKIASEQYDQQKEDRILHTLVKPTEKGFPYLISALPEFNLAKTYRFWSRILLVIFFLSGSGAAYLIANRVG